MRWGRRGGHIDKLSASRMQDLKFGRFPCDLKSEILESFQFSLGRESIDLELEITIG